MLRLSRAHLEQIFKHAEESYPNECCGIIVGTPGDVKEASEVYRGRNVVVERARDRYELDPRDIIEAQRRARQASLDIIGYYHSHPDHPARPSQYDTERAWPGYSYIVVSVASGRAEVANSWVYNESTRAFEPEELVLRD